MFQTFQTPDFKPLFIDQHCYQITNNENGFCMFVSVWRINFKLQWSKWLAVCDFNFKPLLLRCFGDQEAVHKGGLGGILLQKDVATQAPIQWAYLRVVWLHGTWLGQVHHGSFGREASVRFTLANVFDVTCWPEENPSLFSERYWRCGKPFRGDPPWEIHWARWVLHLLESRAGSCHSTFAHDRPPQWIELRVSSHRLQTFRQLGCRYCRAFLIYSEMFLFYLNFAPIKVPVRWLPSNSFSSVYIGFT